MEMQNGATIMEDSMAVSISLHISEDPKILLLVIYLIERKTCSHKGLYLNVYNSFIDNNPRLKKTQVFINFLLV